MSATANPTPEPAPGTGTATWYRCICDEIAQVVRPPWWLFWRSPKVILKRNPACRFHGTKGELVK